MAFIIRYFSVRIDLFPTKIDTFVARSYYERKVLSNLDLISLEIIDVWIILLLFNLKLSSFVQYTRQEWMHRAYDETKSFLERRQVFVWSHQLIQCVHSTFSGIIMRSNFWFSVRPGIKSFIIVDCTLHSKSYVKFALDNVTIVTSTYLRIFKFQLYPVEFLEKQNKRYI